MASKWTSRQSACLLIACMLGCQLVTARNQGYSATQDGSVATLLKMSLKSIYEQTNQILRQELLRSFALIDGAARGNLGPSKRGGGDSSLSLGSSPLVFLARNLDSALQDSTVADPNQELFDRAGK